MYAPHVHNKLACGALTQSLRGQQQTRDSRTHHFDGCCCISPQGVHCAFSVLLAVPGALTFPMRQSHNCCYTIITTTTTTTTYPICSRSRGSVVQAECRLSAVLAVINWHTCTCLVMSRTCMKALMSRGSVSKGGRQVVLSSLGMHSSGAARQASWMSAGADKRTAAAATAAAMAAAAVAK